jgi:hypothetical protein
MQTRPVTIAETHAFARSTQRIWNEDELSALIDHLACNPEVGDVIPGTGGVRKLRWGRAGIGKRGGARVIYFFYRSDFPLYLLLAYSKAQATDLTPDEKRLVSALALTIREAADGIEGGRH